MIPRTTLLAACAAAVPLGALARPQDVTAAAAVVRDSSRLMSREPVTYAFILCPCLRIQFSLTCQCTNTLNTSIDENNDNNILVKHDSPDILTTREDEAASNHSDAEDAQKGKIKGGGGWHGSSSSDAGLPATRRPAAGFALVVGMGAVALAGMMS